LSGGRLYTNTTPPSTDIGSNFKAAPMPNTTQNSNIVNISAIGSRRARGLKPPGFIISDLSLHKNLNFLYTNVSQQFK